jgi:hypothetical protein
MVVQPERHRLIRSFFLPLSFLACGLLVTVSLEAQRYTYLSGGIGIHSTFIPEVQLPFSVRDGGLEDGGSYNVSLRQEMGKYFSLELGYAAMHFNPGVQVVEGHLVQGGHFASDRFSLKTNVDVRVYRDRITAYGTFGYTYSIEDTGGSSSIWTCNPSNVLVEYAHLPGTGYESFLSAGAGVRFRLVHELLFEMELGYATSFQEMYSLTVSYEDPGGIVHTRVIEEGKDHFYFRFGFSYPLQPVFRAMGKGVDFLLAL